MFLNGRGGFRVAMVVVAWAVVVAIGYHRVRLAVEGGFWSPWKLVIYLSRLLSNVEHGFRVKVTTFLKT